MKTGRFKATYEMLASIARCIDRQKSFMVMYESTSDQDLSKRTLHCLEDALVATQETMALMQVEARARLPLELPPPGSRKRVRASARHPKQPILD